MAELKIEYLPIDELVTYANNAKIHTAEQIKQIKKSIQEFSMNDPIAIWKNNEIIEGHGRLLALKELGYETVPVIRLDSLTDEQRKAYALVHNKLTMNTDFDVELLNMELDSIGLDMSEFGFDDLDINDPLDSDEFDIEKYSRETKIPHYEIVGDLPTFDEMYDTKKRDELLAEIELTEGIDEDTKKFLIEASNRHTVFNYKKIAEFYAHQNKDVQELMERSALVIIDVKDAIANGYLKLSKQMDEILELSEDD